MKELITEKWNDILELLRTEYGIQKVSFDMWLKDLRFKDIEDDKIIIYTDQEDNSSVSFIQKKYGNFIKSAMAEVLDLDS